LPSSLSAHTTLSIPDRDAFQLHLTPLNSTIDEAPAAPRVVERPSGMVEVGGGGGGYVPPHLRNKPPEGVKDAWDDD
jgi:hypothetical protein